MLSILLGEYQEDLLEEASLQEKAIESAKKSGEDPNVVQFTSGIKAQFDHARIIKSRIDVQISDRIKTSFH
jgi:hypothetical protein